MEDNTNLNTQELYAAWGTTREEHLAKMKKLIERKNAEARQRLAEREVAKTEHITAEATESLNSLMLVIYHNELQKMSKKIKAMLQYRQILEASTGNESYDTESSSDSQEHYQQMIYGRLNYLQPKGILVKEKSTGNVLLKERTPSRSFAGGRYLESPIEPFIREKINQKLEQLVSFDKTDRGGCWVLNLWRFPT